MPRTKKSDEPSVEETPVVVQPNSSADLINALVSAINLTKPTEKKTAVTRKPGSPWDPKDGSKKLKLKRKMYQHSIIMDPETLSNEEIDLLNKVKVGRYLGDLVKIYRRKDHGIDIDYPVKTASQRMRAASKFNSLTNLLQQCVEEAKNPKPVEVDEDY